MPIPSLFTSPAVSADLTKFGPDHWNRVVALLEALLDGADADGTVLTRSAASATGATWEVGGGGGAGPQGEIGPQGIPGDTGPAGAPGAAGALVLLEQYTAAGSAALDFTTGITSTYDEYLIEYLNLLPSVDASAQLQCSENGGAAWIAGTTYRYAHQMVNSTGAVTQSVSAGTAQFFFGTAESTAGRAGISGSIRLFNPLSATQRKAATVHSVFDSSDGNLYSLAGALFYDSVNAVNALRVKFSSGNIASGTVRLYGMTK